MLLEAVGKPLKYRLSTGEEILFQPGIPVEIPDASANTLLKQAGERVRVIRPAIQTGDTITWLRNGCHQDGIVDFVHTDNTGQAWAFVTLPIGEWAAVNMKFARTR
ncbi:MAG: hypothetical protein ABIU05_24735 [Nitrospirales bacterium]